MSSHKIYSVFFFEVFKCSPRSPKWPMRSLSVVRVRHIHEFNWAFAHDFRVMLINRTRWEKKNWDEIHASPLAVWFVEGFQGALCVDFRFFGRLESSVMIIYRCFSYFFIWVWVMSTFRNQNSESKRWNCTGNYSDLKKESELERLQ